MAYSGAEQLDWGLVSTSFGMAFVDVTLDPAVNGQPLVIEFRTVPGADAEFNVQLWKLMDLGGDGRPERVPTQATAPEMLTERNADGHLVYTIPMIDTAAHNRLGLIITRLDAKEEDSVGAYTIVLHP